ncbi:hypothetical protein IMZ38_03655 [Thermosphaera chiliense]|uniref:DUF2029 domain-containing protein n=1 Tax=Thermosphaera chiliense TaxID=3402707 RepID=A0A7M1UTS0_9CREN|nr:hypothetical protein [Thermosphaera aggregans]QOR95003.1 hypothetical protein IMZ38_03655 [Thermosphaera aggregans]
MRIRVTRHVALLVIIIGAGLIVRLSLAPYTSGSDIAQFAGFADTFLSKTLCFFKYSSTGSHIGENWPYPWPYPYGPILVILLSVPRMLAPTPVAHFWKAGVYHVYVPVDWIIASKSVFILFDTLSALTIYLIVKQLSPRKALLATGFYYLNPATIYISSIYGMFDAVAFFPQALSILLLLKRGIDSVRDTVIVSALAGLSVAVKPNVILPALVIAAYACRPFLKEVKRVVAGVLGFATGLLITYMPFELFCPGSLIIYYQALKNTGTPGYTPPLCYSFNGFSSLATYMNSKTGGDFTWVTSNWWIPVLILFTLLFLKLFKEQFSMESALENFYISYLIFLTTYWRVNYQYFAPMMGFTSMYFVIDRFNTYRRGLSIIYSIFVIIWFFMFPVSWWGHAHIENPNYWVISLLDSISLMVFAEEAYLLYSILLTLLGYVVLTAFFLPLKQECNGQVSRDPLNPG